MTAGVIDSRAVGCAPARPGDGPEVPLTLPSILDSRRDSSALSCPPANLEVLNSHRYGGTVASEKDQVSAYKFFRKFTSPLSPYPSSWPRDGKKGHSSMAAGCRRGCGHGDWLLLLRMDRHDMTVYNYELFLGSWKQRLGSTAVLKRSTIWCKHTLVTSHAAVTVQ